MELAFERRDGEGEGGLGCALALIPFSFFLMLHSCLGVVVLSVVVALCVGVVVGDEGVKVGVEGGRGAEAG